MLDPNRFGGAQQWVAASEFGSDVNTGVGDGHARVVSQLGENDYWGLGGAVKDADVAGEGNAIRRAKIAIFIVNQHKRILAERAARKEASYGIRQ
jgi:hypothetical protein